MAADDGSTDATGRKNLRAYSLPTPIQKYGESIVVHSRYEWMADDEQATTYHGL